MNYKTPTGEHDKHLQPHFNPETVMQNIESQAQHP